MNRKTKIIAAVVAASTVIATAAYAAGDHKTDRDRESGMHGNSTMMQGHSNMMQEHMHEHMHEHMRGHEKGFGQNMGMQKYGDHGANTPSTVESVRESMERYLQRPGNSRLKIGSIVDTNETTITAQIETKDGSVVHVFEIDKATGKRTPVL